MKITERDNRPPGDYDREEWRRLVEDFEWLEDHCWVLPPEEREKPNTATAPPKERDSAPFKLSEMIDLAVKMAEADARLMLTMKVRQVAELDRRRAKLVHLLKERSFDLAARQVAPGRA